MEKPPEDMIEMNTDDRKAIHKPARGKRGVKKSLKNHKAHKMTKLLKKSGSRRGARR